MFHFHVPSFTNQGEFGEEADVFGPLESLLATFLPLPSLFAHPSHTTNKKRFIIN